MFSFVSSEISLLSCMHCSVAFLIRSFSVFLSFSLTYWTFVCECSCRR